MITLQQQPLRPYNTPLYRLYNRKNPKYWHPKMVTDPCISLATNPTNPRILLQSTPSRVYQSLPVDLHSVSSRSSHTHTSTSCRLTCHRYLRLRLYPVDSLDLRLVVDLPRLRPVVDPPRLRLVVDPPRLFDRSSTSTVSRFTSTRLSLQRI
jgi:hypothetical protein